MLFTRYPRYEPLTMTERKVSAFLRKQEKERARYPLFSDHIEAEQHSLDDEIVKRVQCNLASAQRTRDQRAQSWRKARAMYFAQPEQVKEKIRAQWLTWVGPRDPSYFYWMVDVHSGEQARRVAACEEETAKIRARVIRELEAQTSITLA